MQFYIKEWSERSVALMLGTGQVLAYFPSVLEALAAIKGWYQFNDLQPQAEVMLGDSCVVMQDTMDTLHSYGF
ncbi:MAG: hypothetical protein HYZ31_09090 [Gammaproteobacteria bacterium]|jgi:hypothetical protein|nr:hypothetical protein [Gammaproteobacteria bacterium]